MHTNKAKPIGKGMIYIAAIGILVLLTLFFDTQLDKQNNPNRDISSITHQDHIEIRLQRNRAGHYVATGSINGQTVDFLVDTGASDVAIPGQLAQQLDLPNLGPATFQTANGLSQGYYTRLDSLTIGKIILTDVRASVAPNLDGEILLIMSALGQLDWRQEDRQLIVQQTL